MQWPRASRKVTHRLWTGAALAPLGRLAYSCFLLPTFPLLPLERAPTATARPRHAAVVAGALAGLSFAYGAYPVVIADTPR
ncbi:MULTISPECIES: hypothetical protein [Streptomyces]|uniref:Uncharacterized protein n=1 Tax=Streptomyces doebereineriae TaxID=3075528 RepID=A0ABU2V3D9_9ACTN|nr:hypothetical protein [Streptomyces sp. DSM 41640]MDT0479924.1 hypothetical protein [Streptomyces sp. DSM 41640]